MRRANRESSWRVAIPVLTLGLALFLAGAEAPAPPTMRLDVRHQSQGRKPWCWATSVAMAVEYATKAHIEVCELVSLYDHALGGEGKCCPESGNPEAPECLRGAANWETTGILNNIYRTNAKLVERALTWDEVVAAIAADSPILVQLNRPHRDGHILLIIGYQAPDTLIIDDPARGTYYVSYAKFADPQNPRQTWNASWVVPPVRPEQTATNAAVTKRSPGHFLFYDANAAAPEERGRRAEAPVIASSATAPLITKARHASVRGSLPTLGGMAKVAAMRRLQALVPSVQPCYEKGYLDPTPPPSPANVVVAVEVEWGEIKTARIASSTLGLSSRITSCVRSAVARWSELFPEQGDFAPTQKVDLTFTAQ